MASTGKTTSDFIIDHYSYEFNEKFEQVDVDIVIVVNGNITVTDVMKRNSLEREANAASEELIIEFETVRGERKGCIARGKWLLILITTLCLIVALLIFGNETVIAILEIISRMYKGV